MPDPLGEYQKSKEQQLRDRGDDKPIEWGKVVGGLMLFALLWLLVLGLVWVTARVIDRL